MAAAVALHPVRTDSGAVAGGSATATPVRAKCAEACFAALVGNFPQAFSHIVLVNSAYSLTQARKPVRQRAQNEHSPPEEVAAAAAD